MFLAVALMSSDKSYCEGINTSFVSACKYFGNDIAMFVLLMESTPWFAWSRNFIASVQVLMTRMIDCLMCLAVDSNIFQLFYFSLVTWVMTVCLLAQLFEFFERVILPSCFKSYLPKYASLAHLILPCYLVLELTPWNHHFPCDQFYFLCYCCFSQIPLG